MGDEASPTGSGPLADVLVLDIATFIAAPFCGTLLAEYGADVIKIEQPGQGDTLRRFGTPVEGADTLVWASEARNKRSMTLDLRTSEGRDILLKLVAQSDVVLENFRPGTLEKWGLGFDALCAANPRIIVLRVSGYGQTGPMRSKPGFARIAHAFSGLAYLAAEPGGKPVVPGSTSLADYMTGLFSAVAVLVALRHVERTGEGQEIDIALYESVFRVLDEMASVYAHAGLQREPLGADTVNAVPHSHYQARDGAWVAIACTTDRMWQRLAKSIGVPGLDQDERYATSKDRERFRERINAIVADWVGRHDASEVVTICDSFEAPAARLMTISEIFEDPQFAARGNLMTVHDPRIGDIVVPAPLPRMSRTPPRIVSTGPSLGNATYDVLRDMLGQTIGNLVAGSIAQSGQERALRRAGVERSVEAFRNQFGDTAEVAAYEEAGLYAANHPGSSEGRSNLDQAARILLQANGSDPEVAAFLNHVDPVGAGGQAGDITVTGHRGYLFGSTIDNAGIWVGEKGQEIAQGVGQFIQNHPGIGIALTLADGAFAVVAPVKYLGGMALDYFKDEATGFIADKMTGPQLWSVEKGQAGGGGFVLAGGIALSGLGAIGGGLKLIGGSTSTGSAGGFSGAYATNGDLVQSIATRADNWGIRNGMGNGPLVGTAKHGYAEALLNRHQRMFGDRGLTAEARYIGGAPWQPGMTTTGSIRLDVVEGPLANPTHVWDYKFGQATLSPSRTTQIQNGIPNGANVPILMVKP